MCNIKPMKKNIVHVYMLVMLYIISKKGLKQLALFLPMQDKSVFKTNNQRRKYSDFILITRRRNHAALLLPPCTICRNCWHQYYTCISYSRALHYTCVKHVQCHPNPLSFSSKGWCVISWEIVT